MQTVSIQLGHPGLEVFTASPELVSADALGIELELEGFTTSATDRASELVHPLWTIVPDGSLRNGGVEFITSGGLGGTRLAAAIHQIQDTLEVVNYDASWRCSTHMHINMLDFTVNQVVRFLLVYTAVEPILFQFCGAYRKSSNFCTPVVDSLPFHRSIMSRMWDDAVTHRAPVMNCNKYVALNLLPLFPDQRNGRALGTVEFRGGRPLVTREDMFKQANLLLSIKDYVRNFTGTEEEMLTALGAGVHTTVYANGVSAGLEPSVDEMEHALVASWMLLKSYQEGVAQRRRMLESNQYAEQDVPAPTAWGSTRASASRSSNTPSHVRSDFLSGDFTLEQLQLFIGREWPTMLQFGEHLNATGNPRTQMAAAYQVARGRIDSARSIAWEVYTTAILNWAGHLTPSSHEQTPVATLLRLRSAVMNYGNRHREPQGNLPGLPTNAVRPCRVLYQQELGEAAWLDIVSRAGYSRTSTKNIDMWNFLANHQVRTKGRESLQQALSEAGVSIVVDSRMSTFKMYNLLRYVGLPSARHIWAADLPAYDNFMYILSVLHSEGLEVPVIYGRLFNDGSRCTWSRVNGTLGLDLPMRVANRTREGQTVARTMTGVPIY